MPSTLSPDLDTSDITNKQQDKQRYSGYGELLATYLKPQWHRTLLMAAFLLSSVGLKLLSPLILRTFIDTIVTGGAASTLLVAAVSFILVALLSQGTAIATTYFSENIA